MEESTTKIEINEFDKAKFISEYEILNNISFNERITTYFNDYALYNFRDGVDESKINEIYNKALEFVGITENELSNIIRQPIATNFIKNCYYCNQVLKDKDKLLNYINKSKDYNNQIKILRNEVKSIKQDYNYDDKYKDDESFIKHNEMLEQLTNEYEEYNSPLFSSIKELNKLNLDKIDVKEDIFAIFDKETGKYIQVEIEKGKEYIVSDKNEEITLDKILDELVNRTDIKTLTLDIHVDGKSEKFVTSNEPGKSISNAVEKIREVVKDFDDIVIIYSKEELDLLQKEWRELNSIEEPKEITRSITEAKSYEDTKAEFAEKINNNENMSKGYIRISDDNFIKLGSIIDNYKLPYVANKSNKKDGINITVPIDKMDQLKEILSSKDIKSLQIVYGNIDWQNIKDAKPNVFTNVTKEEFMKFHELNNNQNKFIAFENNKGYSIYTEKDCKIQVKSIDNSKEKPIEKGASNKKSNNKTLNQVKKSVEDTKNENASKETQNKEKTEIVKIADKSSKTMEKTNNNKER